MADAPDFAALNMLLVEPVTLLRRTVSLTARSMGVARVHEAASNALAMRLLKGQAFDGAVIAIDETSVQGELHAMSLLDEVRAGGTASQAGIPIAVMLERCDSAMLTALQQRGVTRILLKPFRARNLLDTFSHFAAVAVAPPGPGGPRPLFGVAPG
ncbi:MAG TPA: response regulator [Telluria sp.]|jgi:CheY-like chemotaxis protein